MRTSEDEMVALALPQQVLDRRAPPRHLRVGKARIFGCNDAREIGRKRHEAFFGSATIMSSSMRAPGDDN